MVASDLIEAILTTFLRPTVDRLSEQTSRAIGLDIKLKVDGEIAERRLISTLAGDLAALSGEVRIVASDTAVSDRYKYVLHCIFEHDEALAGLSGFERRGAVTLRNAAAADGDTGFSYTYNDWSWRPKLRDF